MAESAIMRRIMLAFARGGTRLFRVNAGAGWTGRTLWHTGDRITLAHPRRFHGVPAGVSDLIGWTSIEVTPEMVGRRVAIFTALEVKAPDGRERRQQARFRRIVTAAGGAAALVRNETEAAAALSAAGRAPAQQGPKSGRSATQRRKGRQPYADAPRAP